MKVDLRPWRDDDAAALRSAAATTPDLLHQLGGADLETTEACVDFIQRFLVTNSSDSRNFAIAVDDEAVGNVGLSNIERQHGTGWTYYWVAAQHQRQGLATQGLITLAHWAFQDLGLFRLELGHRVNSYRSSKTSAAMSSRTCGSNTSSTGHDKIPVWAPPARPTDGSFGGRL